jgi:hypothetical protein
MMFFFLLYIYKMPVYKDTAANRKLGRVGKKYGKALREEGLGHAKVLRGDIKRKEREEAKKAKRAEVKPAKDKKARRKTPPPPPPGPPPRRKKAVKTTTLDSGAYKAQFGKRGPQMFDKDDRKKQSEENRAATVQFRKGKKFAQIVASRKGETPQKKKRKEVAQHAAIRARVKGFGKGVPTKQDEEDARKKRQKEIDDDVREAMKMNRSRDYAKEREKEIRAKQRRANTVKYGNRRKR